METLSEKRGGRTNLLLSFCDMACPDFRKMSKANLSNLATNLHTKFQVLDELHGAAKAFREKHPKGVKVKGELPVWSRGMKNLYEYKQIAAAFIKKNTGIVLPVSPVIPASFYNSVISYCIITD